MMMDLHPSDTVSPNKSFPPQVAFFGPGVLSQQYTANQDMGRLGKLQNLIGERGPSGFQLQASVIFKFCTGECIVDSKKVFASSSRQLTVFIHLLSFKTFSMSVEII